MSIEIIISNISFTGFNVRYTGNSDISDTILNLYDGQNDHTHALTSMEFLQITDKTGLSLSFTDFSGFSTFKIDYPYIFSILGGGLTTISLAFLQLGSIIDIPFDTTLNTGKVTLENCNGCNTLYYATSFKGVKSGNTTPITIPALNDNGSTTLTVSWSLIAGQEYILWVDAENGNTNGTEVHITFSGPTAIATSYIDSVIVNDTSTSADAVFFNCNGLNPTSYKLFIGVNDGSGKAQDRYTWSKSLSLITSPEFRIALKFSEFTGFSVLADSSYVLWIDNSDGSTRGEPGTNSVAYIFSTPPLANATYYITISYGANNFKGQFIVNNGNGVITSFVDSTSQNVNLLGTGDVNIPGNNAATNDFYDTGNGPMFGQSNTNLPNSINYWTYLDITKNATLQAIANSINPGSDGIALYNLNWNKNVWIAFRSGIKDYSTEQTTIVVSTTQNEKSITVLDIDNNVAKINFSNCSGLTGKYIFANIKMGNGTPPYLAYKYKTSADIFIDNATFTSGLIWNDFTKVGGTEKLSLDNKDSLSIYINATAANTETDSVTVYVNTIIPGSPPTVALNAHDLNVTDFQLDYKSAYTSSTNDKITVTTADPDKSDSYITTDTIVGPVNDVSYSFSGFTVPKPVIVGNTDYTVGLWTNYGTLLNNTTSMKLNADITITLPTTTGAKVEFNGCTGLQAAGYKLWVKIFNSTITYSYNNWNSDAKTLSWSNFIHNSTQFSPLITDNCVIFIDKNGSASDVILSANFQIGDGSLLTPTISLSAYTPNELTIVLTNDKPKDTIYFVNKDNTKTSIENKNINGQSISLSTFKNFIGFQSGVDYTLVLNNNKNNPSVMFNFPTSVQIIVDNATTSGAKLKFVGPTLNPEIYKVSIKNTRTGTINQWILTTKDLPTTSTFVSWSTFLITPAVADSYIIFIDTTLTNTNSFVSSDPFAISSIPGPVTPSIVVSQVGLYGLNVIYSNYAGKSGDYLLITGNETPSQYNFLKPIDAYANPLPANYVFKQFSKFTPVTGKDYTLILYSSEIQAAAKSSVVPAAAVKFKIASIVVSGPITLQNTGTITFNGCTELVDSGYSLWVKVIGSTNAYKWSSTIGTITTDPFTIMDGINWIDFTGFRPVYGDRCSIYISQSSSSTNAFAVTTVTIPGPPGPVPCFRAGTRLLCDINGTETYLPIETLKPGMRVKTSSNGFVPIDMIGYTTLKNPGHSDRIQNRLYKCSTTNYPELTEDLYITGCHSILVDDLTETQKQATLTQLKDIFVTKGKYRLMACIDERALPFADDADYPIWHVALENTEYYQNYGVWANGLLVETCSKRYLKELSGMTLVV